jgi:hypothetical protein
MKRTREEQRRDDIESVASNINDLGPFGAMVWARQELSKTDPSMTTKRRMLILTIRAASKEVSSELVRSRRMMHDQK